MLEMGLLSGLPASLLGQDARKPLQNPVDPYAVVIIFLARTYNVFLRRIGC